MGRYMVLLRLLLAKNKVALHAAMKQHLFSHALFGSHLVQPAGSAGGRLSGMGSIPHASAYRSPASAATRASTWHMRTGCTGPPPQACQFICGYWPGVRQSSNGRVPRVPGPRRVSARRRSLRPFSRPAWSEFAQSARKLRPPRR